MSWTRSTILLLVGACLGAALSGALPVLNLGEPWALWAVHPGPDGPCLHTLAPAEDCRCDCAARGATDTLPLVGAL